MPQNGILLGRFSFQSRPIPVPGDLRIGWRIALIVLMLGHSRSKRASLAKLHVLNDAIRSEQHQRLRDVADRSTSALPWNLHVEPAFARAIDFVVGDELAGWTKTSDRAALQLTATGVKTFESLSKMGDVLVAERAIIAEHAKGIREDLVTTLLGEGLNAA